MNEIYEKIKQLSSLDVMLNDIQNESLRKAIINYIEVNSKDILSILKEYKER